MKNNSFLTSNRWTRLCLFILSIFLMLPLSAQNRRINGLVVDQAGDPLPGANVVVVGNTSIGTTANMDGKFSLNVPAQAALSASFLGYKTKVVRLPKGNQNQLRIVLEEDSKALGEVVVTALGISREAKSLGYARQAIDTESLQDTRDPNLLNSLSGRVAGVNFISNGGPLSSTRVEIRGNNSVTGNNQPLYVIDGVPISNAMGESGDLDYGNPASAINPDDIESIEVLKGANASALYGSDAANGVILITTRKATKKKGLGVSYNYNMQFSYLRDYPLYQNIYGTAGSMDPGNNRTNYPTATAKNGYSYDASLPYGIYSFNWQGPDYRNFGLPMLGYDVVGRNNQIRSYSPSKETVSEMYTTGRTITNSVSVDKVLNGFSMRFGYTGIDYKGILENFDIMKRHMFNLRMNADLASWLMMEASVNYQLENADNRAYKGASDRNPLYAIMKLPREATVSELTPWKDENGRPFSISGFNNPYWLVNECTNGDERNWFRGNFSFTLKPMKGLRIRLRASADTQTKKGWKFDNYYSMWDVDGRYETFNESSTNYNYEALATYSKNFKDISFNANVGTSLQKNSWKKTTVYVDQLAAPDVKSLSNNASILKGYDNYSAKEKQGVYGMLSVGYEGMFVDGTFRNDWSSSLSKANNSYFYASGSASLVLTEIFPSIKNKVLSFAKLRGSIAKVGNDCGFDQLNNGYTYGGLFRGDMTWFTGDNYRKNPELKPETTISKEVGVEVHLLNRRLTVDVTYYAKSTRDQIIQSSLSYLSGYQRRLMNSGEISNKGWEISLSGSPIKTRSFEWKTIINWSKNNSMVESLPDGIDKIEIGSGMYDTKSYAEVGKPYGALYAHTYKRDEEGHILCDINALPKESPDMKYVGCVQADWRGGWSNTFRIGNLGISCMIDFQKGGKFLSQSATEGATAGYTVQSLQGRDDYFFSSSILGESAMERNGFLSPANTNSSAQYSVLYPDWQRGKGVTIPNCVYDSEVAGLAGQTVYGSVAPVRYWQNTRLQMERFIYDASYIKLREITISYNIPKNWIRKLPIQNLRLAAVGRNIATLFSNTPKGLDPQATSTTGNAQGFERGFNLPSATYGFDIKVNF